MMVFLLRMEFYIRKFMNHEGHEVPRRSASRRGFSFVYLHILVADVLA